MSPIAYRLHDDLRLLVTTWTGTVTDAVAIAAYREAYANGRWAPGFNEVTDLRGADMGLMTAEGLRNVQNVVQESVGGYRGSFRTAILAPTDLSFGLARMYELFADESPEAVQVFRDVTAAAAWIGVPVSVIDGDR